MYEFEPTKISICMLHWEFSCQLLKQHTHSFYIDYFLGAGGNVVHSNSVV